VGTSRFGLGSRRRRSALLLAGGAFLVLAAVLVLPGRGGGESAEPLTKPAYERAVRAAYADVQAAFAATRVQSPSELPARLAEAEASLRRAAGALGSIESPPEVAREHGELVEGLAEYAEDLERFGAAASLGSEAVEQIAEAAEEMKFKGYDLGRIAAD
jgi:hypothetical protein